MTRIASLQREILNFPQEEMAGRDDGWFCENGGTIFFVAGDLHAYTLAYVTCHVIIAHHVS